MGVTGELARFCSEISLDHLPAPVVERARFLVLDLVGNIVRARHDAESTASFLAATRAMGLAAGNAGVFGDASRYTPAGAAFLNGALAHSLDFDDTHAAGSLHPGAPVIPAALAAGEMVGASGADVLAAIVAAGYEVACRVALALPAGNITTVASIRPRLAGRSARRRRRRGCSGWMRRGWRARSARCAAQPVRRRPAAVFSQRRLD